MTLKRIAVTFNGSLPDKDYVAAIHRSFVRELQPLLLDKAGFDAFYRLDDECKIKDVRSDVFCYPPTLQSLEKVIQDIQSKFGDSQEVSVFTFVNGHGSASHRIPAQTGWIDGRDFADVLGKLPSHVSRITHLHMCYAGGYAAFGLVDENDLLMAYSGEDEVNWSDASGIAILQGDRDPNHDGILTLQEAFWLGQNFIYNSFAPYRRRFVFLRGSNFIDRGFGTKVTPPPFPPSLVEVPDVRTYLNLTKSGAKQGITVIGFEGRRGDKKLKEQLEKAAAQNGGATQFLWVPKSLAQEAARPRDLKRARGKSFFKFFYHGSDESLAFSYRLNVGELLAKIYRGEEIGEKNR